MAETGTTLQKIGEFLAWGIALCFVLNRFGCFGKPAEKPNPEPLPTTIQSYLKQNPRLLSHKASRILAYNLELKDDFWDSPDILEKASNVAHFQIQNALKLDPSSYEHFHLMTSSFVKDKYGDQSAELLFDLVYDLSEAKKVVDWEHVDNARLLNFAHVEKNTSLGKKVISSWCAKDHNRERASTFCSS